MSERYPGGFITKDTPVTTQSSATGVWTLDQALQATRGGNWPVNGPFYIEDVFSTWLYTGNGGTQTITNNIDITGKGALVWLKRRTGGTGYHVLTDTVRGAGLNLSTNDTIAQYNDGQPTFNSNGFNLINNNPDYNASGSTYASWTFREQPRFFDVVTWTGNGVNGRNISHGLGSIPGCIIVKRINAASDWTVYHRSLGTVGDPQSYTMALNTTAAQVASGAWNDSAPTSTTFQVSSGAALNASGGTYVAYLFAHNAGGFGLSGTENVITCGSFTTNASGVATVNLGYEPQWVMTKVTNTTGSWGIKDNMRGLVVDPAPNETPDLYADLPDAESQSANVQVTSTGFRTSLAPSRPYIYIAIRRGPMKVPTTGASVFSPLAVTPSTNTLRTIGFASDLNIAKGRTISDGSWVQSRLTGFASDGTTGVPTLLTPSTAAETTANSNSQYNYWNTTARDGAYYNTFSSVFYNFGRAPSFFDEVCYTGTGSAMLINHNLGVPPELIITKRRNATSSLGWIVSSLYWFASTPWDRNGRLNQNSSLGGGGVYEPASSHSATQYPVSAAGSDVNASGGTYVAYLFATCPGVSKVGSYIGTGTTQTINCGFTGGARFVMIKRADSTGDWYVWDTARGMIPANDPYLLVNSAAAEVTGTDFVDTAATGFEITSTAPAAINASGGTFIYLAIA